jgi:amphi-Trp domain-containing protein
MGRETRLFRSKEQKRRMEVSNFLHQLADKVEAGTIVLSQGSEDLVLELPEALVLEVQVEDEEKGARGVQHSLEVELKWFDGEESQSLELK